MTWTKVKAAGLVAAAAMAAAACGKASAEQAPQQAQAEQPAPPQVVTVVARDYAFEAPAEVQAGLVTFQLQNRGQQLHHMAVLRLDQGKTLQDLFAAMQGGGPLPAWAREVGGPNAPAPGGDANATMMLQPGNYALLCFVDIPDHVPHLMKGMAKMLRVTAPAATPASQPAITGDVTMTLNDYSFTLSTPITAGRHTIRVQNPTANQSHEVELVKLAPGKTLQNLMDWIADPQGPPPGQAIGGIAGMAKGEVASFTYDFTPGEYGWICFVPGPDGRPHFMHGMMQQFTVS